MVDSEIPSLKERNITRIFKKDDPFYKSNYRPVSIFPLFSKVCERHILITCEIMLKHS